jgi:cytochrome oxidase assembly protein ShyY1
LTYNAFLWQKRRRLEKIEEMELRYKRLNSEPYVITNNFPWTTESFKSDWEFRPVKVNGVFGENCIHVQRTKDSEPGYHLVCPLYIESNKAVLVDRGWVPLDLEAIKEIDKNKDAHILGVLYQGDKLNKYSADKIDNNSHKILTMDPLTIAKILKLPNFETSGTFIIKELNNNDISKPYPVKLRTNDLMTWYITPETHRSYSNFWLFATVANILTNLYIWLL